jgi:hypothetical protein
MEFHVVYYFIKILGIFGLEEKKVTGCGEWRKLRNEDVTFNVENVNLRRYK